MSAWLIALTGLIYLGVAIDQAFKKQYGMATVYVGYALANYGFLFVVK